MSVGRTSNDKPTPVEALNEDSIPISSNRPYFGTRNFRTELVALALPTLVSLIAEPVFLIIDSIIVGHLGPLQLAALGAAGSILSLITSTFIFLAYSTTSMVSKNLGRKDNDQAMESAISGTLLALIIGVVVAASSFVFRTNLLALIGTPKSVESFANSYLSIAVVGVPAMLVSFSALGSLRGFKKVGKTVRIQLLGYLVNAVLDLYLVYGLRLGISGAAIGTTTVQYLVAATYLITLFDRKQLPRLALKLLVKGLAVAIRQGSGLVIRTISLRLAIILTTWVAATMGSTELAAQQALSTLWTFSAFSLDAIALALQVIIGHSIGEMDLKKSRTFTTWGLRWALVSGIIMGTLLVVAKGPISQAFTSSHPVQEQISRTIWILGLLQPLASLVYLLDGVLIGAGDGDFLAFAGVGATLAFLPIALGIHLLHFDLRWLWIGYGCFMFFRFSPLLLRARRDRWIIKAMNR